MIYIYIYLIARDYWFMLSNLRLFFHFIVQKGEEKKYNIRDVKTFFTGQNWHELAGSPETPRFVGRPEVCQKPNQRPPCLP